MSYVKEYVQVHLTVDEEGLVVPTTYTGLYREAIA